MPEPLQTGETELHQPVLNASLPTLLTFALGLIAGHAAAADVNVFAPNAVKESVSEIAARYEQASGNRIVFTWSGTESITKRIGDGEVFDVVVNAAQNIDRLVNDGKLVPGTRTDFARSAIGVAVRAGQRHPDVSSVDALRQALLGADSIAISSGTSGRHLAELFQRLGIAEQLKAKTRQPPSGAQIGEMLARGEAELGFQQVSELLHVKGIDYLGPLPAELQSYTVYSAGLHVSAAQPDAGQGFLQALRAPDAAATVTKTGMEPR